MTRTPGKRGRLAPLMEADRLRIGFIHEYTAQPLPAPVYPVDVSGGIVDWGMLGNGPDPACSVAPDGVGDCTFAGRQHYRMAKAARVKEIEAWETPDQLVTEYLAYNHGVDQGANMALLLQYWYQTGVILGFAPVDHTNPQAVDAAMQAFTGLYCGVSLTDDADDLFAAGKPWTVADGQQPNPNDGHCIVKIRADGKGRDGWITWGKGQASTTDWTAACLEEAWVIITEEDTRLVDLPALQARLKALNTDVAA